MEQHEVHIDPERRKILNRIRQRPFFIKLFSWEYWPYQLIYIPIYFYWLWLSLRARSLFFFSLANPAIQLGGLIGESKYEILKLLPQDLIPRTVYLTPGTSIEAMRLQIAGQNIQYPLIAKPDIGERGFLVEKIACEKALVEYLAAHPVAVIVQEYITYEEEVSILYYRFPGEAQGHITSVTLKEFLSVTGDGESTLEQLIRAYPRALLQWERLQIDFSDQLNCILPPGKSLLLEPIGNHSRGTTFLDGNHLIDSELRSTFDEISHSLEGIYFGRFDVRCKDFDSLRKGKAFSILELNGVKAEPTHIYEPGYSIRKAYKALFHQWNIIYQLGMINRKRGNRFITFREALDAILGFHRYRRMAKTQVVNG